jgi:hypothetical protein
MSTYTQSLGLEEITPGDQAGLWGNTTNNNLALIDQAVTGVTSINFATLSGSTYTLTDYNGAVDEARSAVLNLTGNAAGTNTVVVPNKQKTYLVRNDTGQIVRFQTASPNNFYDVGAGFSILIFCNGNNDVFTGIAAPSVGPTLTTGGGTGLTTYTAGDIPFYAAGTAFSKLGIGPTNYFLSSSGSAPQWSQTLNVANGGTGLNTLTSGSLLVGNGTGSVQGISPTGLNNYVLTSNGSSWVPTLPTSGGVTQVTGSGITVSPTTGNVVVSLSSTNVTTALGYTPLSLTSANTLTGSGSITATAGGIGDQRVNVIFGGNNSGLSPTSLQLSSSGNGLLYIVGGAWDGSNAISMIFNGGAQSLQITSNDNLYTGADNCYKQGSTTAWIIASDARIKKNITPYTKGLTELNQINIKNFEFNGLGNSKDGAKGLGVIADEIEHVLPDAVGTNKIKLRPEDTERTDVKHFDSTELVYLLVNSVKELKAELDEAKAEIAALKAK